MTKGLEIEHEQPGEQMTAKEKNKAIVPKIGDRVTFRAKGGGENRVPALTGEVVSVDDFKGTVTMQCGDKAVPVFRGKGYFFEAPPLEREATKEYAKNLAQERVGENGQVFFARDEGLYKGVIVETTPTYALQEVNRRTIVLHRLKDLGQENEAQIQKGRDVAINKEAGGVTVSLNLIQQEQQKARETAGVER
jgi:hypothetical protein